VNETRITWQAGQHTTHYGMAGGLRLFSITWRSRREDPNWLMRSDLPGHTGHEWRNDDMPALQAQAERILADWLTRVGGES
jgi:hypothetical protein